jgi:hypothetical protein
MKKILILFVITFFLYNCSSNSDNELDSDIPDNIDGSFNYSKVNWNKFKGSTDNTGYSSNKMSINGVSLEWTTKNLSFGGFIRTILLYQKT